MANKKISYNDLKKQSDNSQLAQAFSAGKAVVSQNTGFEKVKVEEIAEDAKGDFTEIFSFNEEAAHAIADSMVNKGFDKTQVIHLAKIRDEPETMTKPIRIDGAHRVAAAKIAGIEEIPAYIHTFDTRTEALIYAYELQILRRNLEPYQKLDAMAKLDQLKNPGKKNEGEPVGKSSEEIADVLGVSTRTAERMRNIINNADEKTLEAVKSGEMSISRADKITNAKKKPKPKNTTDDLEEYNRAEALSDSTGTPAGLNFSHTDGIERPKRDPWAEDESDRRLIERYKEGKKDGIILGARCAVARILQALENQPEAASHIKTILTELLQGGSLTPEAAAHLALTKHEQELLDGIMGEPAPQELTETNGSTDDIFDIDFGMEG